MQLAGAVDAARSNPVIVNPAGNVQLQYCTAAVVPPTGQLHANCASFFTYAVVASFVELSPVVAVGAVGVPVNAGDAVGAMDESTYADVTVVHVGAPLFTDVTTWFVQLPVPAAVKLLLTFDPGISRNICTVVLPELACSTRPRICVPVGRVDPAS